MNYNTLDSRLTLIKDILSNFNFKGNDNTVQIIDILIHLKKLHEGKINIDTEKCKKRSVYFDTFKGSNSSIPFNNDSAQGSRRDFFRSKMENPKRNYKKNEYQINHCKDFSRSNKEETAKFKEKSQNSIDEKTKFVKNIDTERISKKTIDNIVRTVRATFNEENKMKASHPSEAKSFCMKKSKESFTTSQEMNSSQVFSDKVSKRRSRNESCLVKSSFNNSLKNLSINRSLSKKSSKGKIQNSSFLLNTSISPNKLKLFSVSVNEKEMEKLYLKRETGELNCTRGIPSHKKMNLFNYTLNYITFTRPTDMILNATFKKTIKYQVSVNFTQKNQTAHSQLSKKENNNSNISRYFSYYLD